MAIDCGPDDEIEITVDGDRADQALADLVHLVESGLGEGTAGRR